MKAPWTIMIYMNVEPDGFDIGFRKNQLEMSLIGSTEEVQVIIITDRNPMQGRKPKRKQFLDPSVYKIEKGKQIKLETEPIHEIKNEDFGSPAVLEKFLTFCIEHFPAEKYMLIFWDHGAGNGVTASPDEEEKVKKPVVQELQNIGRRHLLASLQKTFTRLPVGSTFNFPIQERAKPKNEFNRNLAPLKIAKPDRKRDYLYAKEICTAVQTSFGKGNKLDIIAFDACWMQMFENAFAFKDCAQYMVASQNLISLQGFGYYIFLKHLTRLAKTRNITALETAVLLIKSCYLKINDTVDARSAGKLVNLYYNKIYDNPRMTLSCVDLAVTDILAEKINNLSVLLLENAKTLFENIRIARFLCLTYFDEQDPADFDLKVIDLVYFLKKLSENLITALQAKDESDPDIYTPIIDIANEIAEIAEISFVVYKEMGYVMREEKEVDKRWGTHGFSIFFPEHAFEWEAYKSMEGWYFETNPDIQMPFAKQNKWKAFLNKYYRLLQKHI